MKKTQSSLEFITILGIGLTIILILGGLFISFTNESTKDLDRNQLDKIFSEILINVEQIYFRGAGNRIRYSASFPEGIQNISIHQRISSEGEQFSYFNVTFLQEGARTDELYFTRDLYIQFNCSSSTSCVTSPDYSYFNNPAYITGGPKTLVIESRGDWVAIGFVT